MAIAHSRASNQVARILVVDDEPMLFEVFRDTVATGMDCDVIAVCSLDEARKVLARQSIDLLITDVILPDGTGLALLGELRREQPMASALVMTGVPKLDVAIEAMRNGAVDFMAKPFNGDQLAGAVHKALNERRARVKQQTRLAKLRAAYHKLNSARRLVSRKVDLLCGDLIGAYSQMAKQFDTLRLQQGYREFVNQAAGLEQLLCHTMDWLLRQVGYCNIGIWLTTSGEELQLGAYMKYTIPGERHLTEAMEKNLLGIAMRRGFVRLRGPEAKSHLTPAEAKFLADQDIIALNCTYLGDSLGAVVLFRDDKTPFNDEDVVAIKTIIPLFALALTRSVRQEQGAEGGEDDEPAKGKDASDWWKTGEEPPF